MFYIGYLVKCAYTYFTEYQQVIFRCFFEIKQGIEAD